MSNHDKSFWTQIVTFYPLCLTIFNTIFNGLILLILYRKKFRQRPTTHYMRAVALADILMIFGWNFDHFLRLKFGFEIDRLTVLTCKIFMFFNNGFLQSAAWFRVWLCIDRFQTLQRIHQRRTKSQHRSALILIVLTIFLLGILNVHIPIFCCYEKNVENTTIIIVNSLHYQVYPMWSYVHLAVYNLFPFVLMLIFDIRIIRHLISIKSSSTVRCSRVQHTNISLSIFLSALLFFLMTTPATIIFIVPNHFFPSNHFRSFLVTSLDSLQYTYHSISFIIYFSTLIEFRLEFFRLFSCRKSIENRLTRSSVNRAKIYKKTFVPIATISK